MITSGGQNGFELSGEAVVFQMQNSGDREDNTPKSNLTVTGQQQRPLFHQGSYPFTKEALFHQGSTEVTTVADSIKLIRVKGR